MANRLIDMVKITLDAQTTVTNATADASGTILDMAGFDGVMFIQNFKGSATANGLILQGGSVTASMRILASSTAPASATCVVVDYYKPLFQYVNAVVKQSASQEYRGPLISIQYKARVLPTSNLTSLLAIKRFETLSTGAA